LKQIADGLTRAGAGILPDLKYSKLPPNFGADDCEGEQASRWLDGQTMQSVQVPRTGQGEDEVLRRPVDRRLPRRSA
jgi:hypothetical protein